MPVFLIPMALSFLKKAWPYVLIAALFLGLLGYRKAYQHEQGKVVAIQQRYDAEHAAAKSCSDATAKVAQELATKQASLATVATANTVVITQAQSRSDQRVTIIEAKKVCDQSLSDLVTWFSHRVRPLQ